MLACYSATRVEAFQVLEQDLRVIADWLAGGAGKGGWYWYEGQPVQFSAVSAPASMS